MRQLTIYVVFVILLVSCKKNSSLPAPGTVSIRIENSTTENFSSIQLGNTDFGSISIGETSKYFICKNILPVPFANYIVINGNSPYIADIVATPYMNNGKYRMKMESDTLPWRYKASFIKE